MPVEAPKEFYWAAIFYRGEDLMKYFIGKWKDLNQADRLVRWQGSQLARLIFLITIFLSHTAVAFAGDAVLSWDPNTEPDLAGYKVYSGTASGIYGTPIDTGNLTTQTVTGLSSGTYFFAVTAYDTSGNESGFSNEVSKTISTSDPTPPILAAITPTNITSNSATIAWTTDEPADSMIEYGTTTTYGSTTPLDTTLVTAHSQTITALLPATTYNYRVVSKDASGNAASSGNNTFTTNIIPDTTPPVISAIISSNITNSSAVITWATNETATSKVEYGTTTAYGSSTLLNATLVTAHSQTIMSLLPATTYNYRVISTDAAGNTASSGNNIFTTAPASTPDTTPPLISDIISSNIQNDTAVITWATNEAATSKVQYGITTAYGSSTPLNATLVTMHSQTIMSLLPATTYNYRVISTDAAGNTTSSGNSIFTTALTPDTTPPEDVIDFTALEGDLVIALTWTNPPDLDFVGVRIRYKTDGFPSGINDGILLGDFTGQPNKNMSTTHTGLQNNVTYYYAASSYDNNGNFQNTVFVSATPQENNPATQDTSSGGGCGMVIPTDGNPPGPGQAADMIVISGVILIMLLRRRRQTMKPAIGPVNFK